MTGNEPPQIPPRTEHPDGLKHREIRDAFDPVATTPANDAAAKYQQAQRKWSDGLQTFRQRMMSSIAEAWEGQAAEASKRAIVNYTTAADQLTGTFDAMAKLITSTAQSAVDVQKAMPKYEEDPSWYNPKAWPLIRSRFENQRHDAEESARQLMRDYYVKDFAAADNSLPVLPRPVNLAQSSDIPSGSGNGPTDQSANLPGTNSPSGGPSQPGQSPEDTKKEESGTPGTDEPTTNATEDKSDSTTPANTTTTPSSVTTSDSPRTPTTPTTTTPASTTHSTPNIATPGTPTKSSPSPGRSIPGSPASPTATTSKSAMAAGAGTSRGTSGIPGMMSPGGARGKSDDESAHQTPDYLKNEENTRELLGTAPPAIEGGVLGASAPAAQVRPDRPSGGAARRPE